MAKQKNSDNGDETPQQDRTVNRTIVQRDYLERRLQGGAPASQEAYTHAIDQWQQLPGAIAQVPVTKPTSTEAAPTPTDTNEVAPASDAPDKEEQS